jgi:hypothetical protein
MSRYLNLTRSQIYGVISGYIHGSLTDLSSFQEWILKRGMKIPNCTQRNKSSASGAGPENRQHRDRCSICRTAMALD